MKVEPVFISDFFELNDRLDELGVFDSIINKDSHFFINLLRLKKSDTPEFSNAYERVNDFFSNIMILLSASKDKGDRFYREALKKFSFSGLNGVNLGFSETGVDAGFGRVLSEKVISDAFDIVKNGSTQPEIFQLVGLFEENVAADRLSDMIATIIKPDIEAYTRRINQALQINQTHYPDVEFINEIAINPFKNCELLYLPTEVLHELPIARCWDDIDRVISENEKIRNEVNEAVGLEWRKMCSAEKKNYLKQHIFMDAERCAKIIEGYREEDIAPYCVDNDLEYFVADAFKGMKRSGAFNFLEHADKREIGSYDAALKVLDIFKDWVEHNKGWDEIQSASTQRREKAVQRMLHLSGKYYCESSNIDMSFEANEGPGPVDLKVSRGNDKTVVEIKLSSNNDYLHGFEEQIESYAQAEGTNNRIFVYVMVGNPGRNQKIKEQYQKMLDEGKNPPYLYMIDSEKQTSASNA